MRDDPRLILAAAVVALLAGIAAVLVAVLQAVAVL
jgi:hypothetical protein